MSEWPPFAAETGHYLEFGDSIALKQHLRREHLDFWERRFYRERAW